MAISTYEATAFICRPSGVNKNLLIAPTVWYDGRDGLPPALCWLYVLQEAERSLADKAALDSLLVPDTAIPSSCSFPVHPPHGNQSPSARRTRSLKSPPKRWCDCTQRLSGALRRALSLAKAIPARQQQMAGTCTGVTQGVSCCCPVTLGLLLLTPQADPSPHHLAQMSCSPRSISMLSLTLCSSILQKICGWANLWGEGNFPMRLRWGATCVKHRHCMMACVQMCFMSAMLFSLRRCMCSWDTAFMVPLSSPT